MRRKQIIGFIVIVLVAGLLLLGFHFNLWDRLSTVISGEVPTNFRIDPPTISDNSFDDDEDVGPQEAITKTSEISTEDIAGMTQPVIVLIQDDISTLEPYRMVSIHPEESIARHLWDTLTYLNDELEIEPNLAESWRLINNFTWEVKLRKGITFHNGEPVDAEAVLFSINRAQSMFGRSETFATDVQLDRVEVIDDDTIRIITRKPVANLPYHLSSLEILPPHYYSETSSSDLLTAPVGSGPYRLKRWVKGQELVLEAVPSYWKGAPVLNEIVFKTVPAYLDRLNAIENDEAALVTDLPAAAANYEHSSNFDVEAIRSTQRLFVGIHVSEGTPLGDKRVRQALNYGVDVTSIIENRLAGYGERYGSWVNPPADNSDLLPWPYDPDRARELLAEAGYGTGLTMTLQTPVGVYDHDLDIAQDIRNQLKEIGVTVNVEPVGDWGTYSADLLSGKIPDLFLLGLNSRGDGLEDAMNLMSNFPFNPTGWQDESFEEILGRAATTFNPEFRITLLYEAQSIAYEEAPWIWLWKPYYFYGISQDLDWKPRPDGLVNLYEPLNNPEATAK